MEPNNFFDMRESSTAALDHKVNGQEIPTQAIRAERGPDNKLFSGSAGGIITKRSMRLSLDIVVIAKNSGPHERAWR